MKGKHRKEGGRAHMWVAGNPEVKREAEEETSGHKHGGKVKRAKGGKVLGKVTGGGVRARLDRPGRKTGGRVGADKAPLSSAHHGSKGSADGSSSPTDTYGGTP